MCNYCNREISRLESIIRELEANATYMVYGFGGVITEFNTLDEAKEHAKTCDLEIKKITTLKTYEREKPEIANAKKTLFEKRDIIEAIRATEGWFSEDRKNQIYIYHDKLKNFLFDAAFKKMPINYKKHLLQKFCHPMHFIEGVTRAHALEYYYLSRNFNWEERIIRNTSTREKAPRDIKPTIPMKAYWHAIDEMVIAIADGNIDITNII